MSVSRTAREIGLALRAGGRRRVPLENVRALLLEIEPQVAASPRKRRRLWEIIDDLAGTGDISLPRGKAQYDRLEQPVLPRFVLVEGLPEARSTRAPGASRHPWLPELRWAASIRPPLRKDEMEFLLKVSTFLSGRPAEPMPAVPLQERSLQLLGNEKRLADVATQRLFGPGRLSPSLLAFREVHPPFVHTRFSDLATLLVLENSATYDTMTRVLSADGPIGVVAYGAGKHFIASVLAAQDLVPPPRRILYFGDVDPEGLWIPIKASATAAARGLPPVEPAEALYDMLFSVHLKAEPCDKEGPGPTGIDWLPQRVQGPAARMLKRRERLAQEWVGLEMLMRHSAWISGLRRQLASVS